MKAFEWMTEVSLSLVERTYESVRVDDRGKFELS